jgi:hypothetical protein
LFHAQSVSDLIWLRHPGPVWPQLLRCVVDRPNDDCYVA